MFRPTDDLRIQNVRPLISPAILLEEIPLSERASNVVADARAAIAAILAGGDDRLVVIAGPCSIHDPEAALDCAARLKRIADSATDTLLVVMRAYFEKPRTVVGWKGLINDPDMDGSYHINKGLRRARRLLLDVNELGLPTGSEFLDTQIPQFIADLTSWACIGARTVESQVHRELASGLSMPVGFKNGTDGDAGVAVDAVLAARQQHWFPGATKQGLSAILQTTGNESCHVILRGGSRTGPNYDAERIESLSGALTRAGLPSRLMVDCSHGNSQRDPNRQAVVASDLARQIAAGSGHIFGVMLESHLVAGRQDHQPGVSPGVRPEHHRCVYRHRADGGNPAGTVGGREAATHVVDAGLTCSRRRVSPGNRLHLFLMPFRRLRRRRHLAELDVTAPVGTNHRGRILRNKRRIDGVDVAGEEQLPVGIRQTLDALQVVSSVVEVGLQLPDVVREVDQKFGQSHVSVLQEKALHELDGAEHVRKPSLLQSRVAAKTQMRRNR